MGLECGDLLFQGEETLLHLVKLQGQRGVTSAGFASWVLILPLYLLDVGLKQQLGPHGLGAAPAPAHVVADVSVAPGELLRKDR